MHSSSRPHHDYHHPRQSPFAWKMIQRLQIELWWTSFPSTFSLTDDAPSSGLATLQINTQLQGPASPGLEVYNPLTKHLSSFILEVDRKILIMEYFCSSRNWSKLTLNNMKNSIFLDWRTHFVLNRYLTANSNYIFADLFSAALCFCRGYLK